MKTFAALACVAALAGCNEWQQRRAALDGLLGQSETDLVRQLGAPTRTFEARGHRFLAYDVRAVTAVPGGYGFAPSVAEWSCEATFEVVNARVWSWSLRGYACG
ncbi:MAG TPA: hypothetical protein VE650_09180 [Acetobacteraceae bacterium]|nr:hypothetical protein [Acetobacteraceae bacterium]